MKKRSITFDIGIVVIIFALAVLILHLFVRPIDGQFLLYLGVLIVLSVLIGYILFRWIDPKSRFIKVIGQTKALITGPQKLEHGGDTTYKVLLAESFNKGQFRTLPELMVSMIQSSKVDFDRLIGLLTLEGQDRTKLTREGYYIVPIISYLLNKPSTLLFETKIEETGEVTFLMDGILRPSERVLIVDDVLTTGESILNATRYLLNKQVNVSAAFVFVSRSHGELLEKNRRDLQRLGVNFQFLMYSKELLESLGKEGYIDREKLDEAYKDKDFHSGR